MVVLNEPAAQPAQAPRTLVGAHVPVAGGLGKGLDAAARLGAEVIQVFLGTPRGWRPPIGDPAADRAFRDRAAAVGVPVFVHAPFLVNLGSPTTTTRERSAQALAQALERGRAIGARGVVFHAGSAVLGSGVTRADALAQSAALLRPLLDDLTDDHPDLLVEPTAGTGENLAARVEDLAEYLRLVDGHPRLGVCLDTCHAFAAGHDLATPAGTAATLDALVAAAGPGRLRLVHVNDSADPLGSRRDRHANLGAGQMGTGGLGMLFTHPVSAGVPLVIETPGPDDAYAADLQLLAALRDAADRPARTPGDQAKAGTGALPAATRPDATRPDAPGGDAAGTRPAGSVDDARRAQDGPRRDDPRIGETRPAPSRGGRPATNGHQADAGASIARSA